MRFTKEGRWPSPAAGDPSFCLDATDSGVNATDAGETQVRLWRESVPEVDVGRHSAESNGADERHGTARR